MSVSVNEFEVIKALGRSERPKWRAFKERWDNNIPRKNSKLFIEYQKDVDEAQKETDALLAQLRKEYKIEID